MYRLDRPITLQRATSTTNSLNEPVVTWNNLTPRIMANRSYKNATEGISAQQISATLISRYIIRWESYYADLNAKDQLIDDGKTYSILAVYELGRREWLEIHAIARVD